jgi:pyrroline-5-carboxylate reductase
MTFRLAVFGGGNMGAALVGGLLAAKWAAASEMTVVEVDDARRDQLADRFPGLFVGARLDGTADGAVIAVKPHDVVDAVEAAAAADVPRLLSIAAGVPTSTIEHAYGGDVAVVRAMPNTPALVGAGAAAIAGGAHAGDADLAWAEEILHAVGTVVRVSEHLLDAVTGLSGSGPAYVFLVAEALVDAGVLVGLPRDTSEALVIQLLAGSARLLAESGRSAADLRAGVTSPAGTTAAGLRALEQAGVRSAFIEAVAAATTRSKELGH